MVIFILGLLTAQTGSQLTHLLSLKRGFGGVRASALLTLIFILLTSLIKSPIVSTLQTIFFGSTFVGMSDPKKMSKIQLSIASFIFTLVFHFLISHFKKFGGALGLSAFVSCLTTYYTSLLTPFIRHYNNVKKS